METITTTVSGATYTGSPKDGEFNGRGIRRYADGSYYEGEFKDGKMEGYGTLTYQDGFKYVGEWKNDKFHGEGIYTYANGDRYVGQFKDGKRNGKGKYTYANGDRYEGEWRDDQRDGHGTLTYQDGFKYSGKWKDDNIMLESTRAKKKNEIPTLLLLSEEMAGENSLLKYETHKFLKGGEKVEVAVCERKDQALAKINEFIKNNQNKDKCRIVFDQHGNKNGYNEMGIDQDCAKEILKSLSKNFRDIIISDLACYGGTAKHFLKVAQGVANKHNNLESITVRYAPQGRFCVAGFKSNNEDSRFSIVTIGKDGSTELRKLMKFKPKNQLKPLQAKALNSNILEGILHHQ